MSVKEIDNQNATKANAARDNNKYIEHDPSKPIKGMREQEPSASRTFLRLIVFYYKKARQS